MNALSVQVHSFGLLGTALLLFIASNAWCEQELRTFSRIDPVQPAALKWDFGLGKGLTNDWQLKNCEIQNKKTNWTIIGKNLDPMMIHTPQKPLAGQTALELRLKTQAQHEISLFWGDGKASFGPERRITKKVYPADDAQSIWFVLPKLERLTSLRIDPMSGKGELDLLRIALHQVKESPDGNLFLPVSGDAEIRSTVEGDPLVLRTTSRLAGAVDSITWRGQEFIDSHDHGRQLQSAINLELSTPFQPETFNPTEAGSRDDGAGDKSTSRLLRMKIGKDRLETTSQMAFWLPPGGKSKGHLAKNKTVLSNHSLTKRIKLSPAGWENLILYETTFRLPIDELHRYAQFEVVTGYMPEAFENFYGLDAKTGKLKLLSDGPGEQSMPVILSTKDEKFAMGVLSLEKRNSPWRGPGYGRFRFSPEKVVKWNLVYRFRQEEPIKEGPYVFHSYVGIGSLGKVRQTFVRLLDSPNENLPLLD
jgi:hypothetical protein